MPDLAPLQPNTFEDQPIACPYCGSVETELFSLFGSQLLTAQYYCRSCHTPFEQVKSAAVLADAARRDLSSHSAQESAEE
jgi:late competence protein required for DNA uptake (superfamily II DNA/RNA helicase)